MRRIPICILNGFLGAGKTTLLQGLLAQARDRNINLAVIMNELSDFDVDSQLVEHEHDADSRDPHYIAITSGSISEPDGLIQLDTALQSIAAATHPVDLVIIETSGAAHPLPLVRSLQQHAAFVLKGLFTLIDCQCMMTDFSAAADIIPQLQANLAAGRRGLVNLLAEQVMFSNHILLTKSDRYRMNELQTMAAGLHPLNVFAEITAVSWGKLDLNVLLDSSVYDYHRVAQLIEELQDEIQSDSQSGARHIVARIFRDERPLHPQRLWLASRALTEGIYRSKGFIWLPSRDDLSLIWNQAANSISLGVMGYWKAGVLAHDDGSLSHEERVQLEQSIHEFHGRFGDRRCHLTVIGLPDEVDEWMTQLQACVLTEAEICQWQNGEPFDDPWPQQFSLLRH